VSDSWHKAACLTLLEILDILGKSIWIFFCTGNPGIARSPGNVMVLWH